MTKSRSIDKKVHDLAKELGYDVWIGSDDCFYAAFGADASKTVTPGATARLALDNAYYGLNPDTPSVCSVMLDNSANVVSLDAKKEAERKKPETASKPPRQAKPKPEPANRAMTGVQFHIRKALLLDPTVTVKQVVDIVTKAGFTPNEGSIGGLLAGTRQTLMIQQHLIESGELENTSFTKETK